MEEKKKILCWLLLSTNCVAQISQDFIFWYQSWRHRRKTSLETTCSENSLSGGEWKKQKGAYKRHKGLRGKQDWECRPRKWQCKGIPWGGKSFPLLPPGTKGLISSFKSFYSPKFFFKGRRREWKRKGKASLHYPEWERHVLDSLKLLQLLPFLHSMPRGQHGKKLLFN